MQAEVKRSPLSDEPYATLLCGGPLLCHQLPEIVKLTLDEIRLLREAGLFPRARGVSCAPWWPRVKIVAYRYALDTSPKLKERVELVLGCC